MECEQCGATLEVGDYPFCPHGRSKPREDGLSSYVQDEIPGGVGLENVGPTPKRVYSYTEMDSLFASQGLTRKEKFSPTPGTSQDPAGVQDSRKYMDPYTLQAGAELILRAAGQKPEADFAESAYINRESRVVGEQEARDLRDGLAEYEKWRDAK